MKEDRVTGRFTERRHFEGPPVRGVNQDFVVVHNAPIAVPNSPPYAGTMSSSRSISVSRLIHAPASRIFDLLADPRQHVLLDGSGSVSSVKSAPERLALGSTFSMHMKMGLGYVTRNRVVVFEENRRHRVAPLRAVHLALRPRRGRRRHVGHRDVQLRPTVGLRRSSPWDSPSGIAGPWKGRCERLEAAVTS